MLVNIQVVLREVLIEIRLKHMIANRISIFVYAIVVTKLLQTIVGKMHIVISVLQVIVI
jgi:hypothetical protein